MRGFASWKLLLCASLVIFFMILSNRIEDMHLLDRLSWTSLIRLSIHKDTNLPSDGNVLS
jgi:hypothetical protein